MKQRSNEAILGRFGYVGLGALGLALAVSAVSMVSAASRAPQDEEDAPRAASLTLVRSVSVPSAQERAEDAAPELQGLDTYIDWDLGTATYLHQSGGLATVPMRPNWTFQSVVTPSEGLFSMALQRTTGIAFFLDDAEWSPITEPEGQDLIVGDYEVFLGVVDAAAYVLRFDRFSGRSWIMEGSAWRALAGNLDGWPEAPAPTATGAGR